MTLPTIAELRQRDSVNPFRGQAETMGLKVFDTALPLGWYEDVHKETGKWPQELGFVWCYDDARVWGKPVPLTVEAEELLTSYESLIRGRKSLR